jgi:hypothetical protein|tara:strand:- start:230 stop:544 length:315 start_codon:yes stop_codon:yes gene_type:complete
MGAKGRPKNPVGWEFSIYAKLKQISKGRKITIHKAWLQLTEHRNFAYLMKPHFQRFKKYKGNTKWREIIKDPDWKKNFYKNNIVRSRLIKRLDDMEFTYTRRKK